MISKVKLILPLLPISPWEQRSAIKAALSLIDENVAPNFAAYSTVTPNLGEFQHYYRPIDQFNVEGDEIVVAIYGKEMPQVHLSTLPQGQFFWINDGQQITTPDGKYDEKLTPGVKRHIFSRVLANEVSAFGDFPYIPTMIDQRFRPITPLGHRIKTSFDFNLPRPHGEHIIAIFGGSTAQGVNVRYDDTFGHQLETLLNTHSANGKGYTVLNFALSGQMLTDEILSYLFFCDRLRPDIVITLNGVNDLTNALMSDSYLVNEWQFSYRYQDEARAAFLNSAGKNDAPPEQIHVKNSPHAVIQCYLQRLEQFASFVHMRGIRFISCLQPTIYSKSALSPLEQSMLSEGKQHIQLLHDIFQQKLPTLMDMLREPLAAMPFETIDFHHIFKQYGSESHFFSDSIHFNAHGEEAVAGEIFRHLSMMHRNITHA